MFTDASFKAEVICFFQTLKASDIATVRKLGKPPHLIQRIMDCVLILFQKKMDPVTQDPDRLCPKPSWGESLKVIFLSLKETQYNCRA